MKTTLDRNIAAWERGGIWERDRTPRAVRRLVIVNTVEHPEQATVCAELADGSVLPIARATTTRAAGAYCRANYPKVRRYYRTNF